jgi:hypothetical protein
LEDGCDPGLPEVEGGHATVPACEPPNPFGEPDPVVVLEFGDGDGASVDGATWRLFEDAEGAGADFFERGGFCECRF